MPRFLSAVPALPVSDERRAVAFWESVLGFTDLLDEDAAGLGMLVRDSVEVHVWVADGSAAGAEQELAGSPSCRLQVEDIDGLYAVCSAAGVVHPLAHLADRPWGNREFGASDPDGSLITRYQQVAS